MQNQLQTECAEERSFTPVAAPHAELESEELESEELAVQAEQVAQQSQAVHTWLANIQQKSRRRQLRYWGLFLSFELFQFVPILMMSSFERTGLWLMFLPAVGLLALSIHALMSKPDWNAEEIAQLGGTEAVGTLLNLLFEPKSPKQLPPIYAALTKLLPQMKASDAVKLTPGQRRILRWSLRYRGNRLFTSAAQNQDFRLAILKAMEQIGDVDCIPIVENLANGRARTPDQEELKAAALECLPLLYVKVGSTKATSILLRASSREAAPTDSLLRAAEFQPDGNTGQLLRATETTASPPAAE